MENAENIRKQDLNQTELKNKTAEKSVNDSKQQDVKIMIVFNNNLFKKLTNL